ncbi:CCA tRNA nucleotidyltransferase 2 [Micractinium conductrix]|uniref:CCA tRNA nucleotidyltransferase 2 n=1 Tax=Micractinium conductrix TaxID=554055 RepID=A0A2P6VS18_9CHLO|nr:CCA tRNA nucleotidyltransferase 2 [Micractinium conductrix]|eukprot:PSC76867.1 CCA tRNA nucleotidyltransferase 2 [Micractinium conductrix]
MNSTHTPFSPRPVREALAHKVSRERVGAELEGMLHGPDPVMAVRLLHRLRIFTAVFAPPPATAGGALPSEDAFGSAACSLTVEAFDAMQAWKHPECGFDQEAQRRCMLAAVLLPLAGLTVPAAKGKPVSAAAHVVRDSLKWKAKDADAVDVLHSAAPELIAVYQALQGRPDGVPAPEELRVRLGRCIRRLKQLWPAGCVAAALLHSNPAARGQLSGDEAEAAAKAAVQEALDSEAEAAGTQRRLDFCEALLGAAVAYGIDGCWQWKPLLDGKQVMAATGMKGGGPALGKLMEAAVDWQLAHPGAPADECCAHLQELHAAAAAATQAG